ncbi:alpha/beta fold hydrolase, partial [Enterobacter ludwigii]
SWGGALALALALDHPERVAGLALVSPVARPFERMPEIAWYWRLALKPPVTWLLSRTLGPPAGLYHLERGARAAFAPQPVAEDYL